MAAAAAAATNTTTDETRVEGSTDWDILQNISEALESWTRRILDAETAYSRTGSLYQNIIDSLQRQRLDGFIGEQDVRELEYVADLWLKLHTAFVCKCCGAEFADRDVLTYLLELFSLKQISKAFFIETALQLWVYGDERVLRDFAGALSMDEINM